MPVRLRPRAPTLAGSMFRPLALYIGLRYTRAKRRQHFVSFISLASMLGIALGVMVLITVLSVMNGFDFEIRNRLFNLSNQVTVANPKGPLQNWQTLAQKVEKFPHVVDTAPYVAGQGMLSNTGNTAAVMITGIDPQQETKVSEMPKNIIAGSFNTLTPGNFNIVIGEGLAASLGANIGDKVLLFTPRVSATPLGVFPRFKQFVVSGIFHVDGNIPMDTGLAFINLQDGQVLYQIGSGISGLRLKVSDLYIAPTVAQELQNGLPPDYQVSDWTQEYAQYFKAIRMEKTMIFLLLVFIIAIAAFNLVSSLVMVVNDKQADIAILRTYGATPRTIMAIFIVQGFVIGIIGTFLGFISGITLAHYVGEVVEFIQRLLHVQLISSNIYIINYLPSRLEWHDVIQVCSIALGMSLLATLYPAWQASRTQPAEALRYE